jgi:hypothetical protein
MRPDEPFKYTFPIETAMVERLRRLGGDPGTHISVAVRRYLKRRSTPVRFENQGVGTLVEIAWIVPPDLRYALPWNPETSSLIVAAIRQYLADEGVGSPAPLKKRPEPPPPVQQPLTKLTIGVDSKTLARLRELGGPLGKHFETAVRMYLQRYGSGSKSPMNTIIERGSSVSEITWTLPHGLERVSADIIPLALQLYLQSAKPANTAKGAANP